MLFLVYAPADLRFPVIYKQEIAMRIQLLYSVHSPPPAANRNDDNHNHSTIFSHSFTFFVSTKTQNAFDKHYARGYSDEVLLIFF